MLKISKEKLENILKTMRTKKVMVLGDLMLDEFIEGSVERISPEAPVPVVEVNQQPYYRLGGSGNVARNLVGLGANVIIHSIVGHDQQAQKLKELLGKHSIKSDYILSDDQRDTIVKTRIIANKQQLARIDRENRALISDKLRTRLIAGVRQVIDDVDAIIISDYGKGMVSKELIDEVVAIARKHDILVSVDPKERNFPYYNNVSLITPNIKELSFGAGIKIETENDMITAADKVREMFGCDMLLITRGEQGMSLFEKDGNPRHIPTAAIEVFDVTGAGDTVIACFTLAHISGAEPIEAASLSNVAAGYVVAVHGTAYVPWEVLKKRSLETFCG